MLKIQVLGKGMIPRGYGLAPRKEFFKADLNLIQTILMTPGLTVNMLNPEDGKIVPVTKANVKKLWDKYRSDIVRKATVNAIVEEPTVAPEVPKAPEANPVKQPEATIKPVVQDTQAVNTVSDEGKVENVVKPLVSDNKKDEKVEEEKKDETTTSTTGGIKPVLNEDKTKNNNNQNNNQNHNKK